MVSKIQGFGVFSMNKKMSQQKLSVTRVTAQGKISAQHFLCTFSSIKLFITTDIAAIQYSAKVQSFL
jgi:hypothetical protein